MGILSDEICKVVHRKRRGYRFTQEDLGSRIGVSGSYISRFGRGIFVSGASPSRAQISSSHITGNQAGLAADQATTTILSAGNNLIRGNVTDINITGTITTGAQ